MKRNCSVEIFEASAGLKRKADIKAIKLVSHPVYWMKSNILAGYLVRVILMYHHTNLIFGFYFCI